MLGLQHLPRRPFLALKAATTRPAASSVVRSAIAGRPANWVFGLEGAGQLGRSQGIERSARSSPAASTNRSKIDAFGLFTGQVGYTWNNALLYVKGGAAVTRRPYDHRRRCRAFVAGTDRRRHPLGRHRRRRPRIRVRAELVGRSRIRPPVHGRPQRRPSPIPVGAFVRDRSDPPGRRPRHRPRQLSLGRPGCREVLICRS